MRCGQEGAKKRDIDYLVPIRRGRIDNAIAEMFGKIIQKENCNRKLNYLRSCAGYLSSTEKTKSCSYLSDSIHIFWKQYIANNMMLINIKN